MAARRFLPVLGIAAVVLVGVVAWRFIAGGDASDFVDALRGSPHRSRATGTPGPASAADAEKRAKSDVPSDPRRAGDPVAATTSDASRERAVWLGRVVGERGFPVADARVTLRLFRSGVLDRSDTKSGADGRFEISAPPDRTKPGFEATLWAVDARGRMGFTKSWGSAGIAGEPPPRIDAGT